MTETEAFQRLGQFPHCDARVLHAPTECEYCDTHPDWQAYRIVMRINFTGKSVEGHSICPAEMLRSGEVIRKWPGNRAAGNGPNEAPPPICDPFDSILED